MSSFANNQSFKKKLAFAGRSNENNKVTLAISLNCNHDVDKHLIESLDRCVNEITRMFDISYVDVEQSKKNKKALSEAEKIEEKAKKKEDKKLIEFKKRMGIA